MIKLNLTNQKNYSFKKDQNKYKNEKFHKINVDIKLTSTGLTRIIKFTPSYLLINETEVNMKNQIRKQ